MTAEGKTKSVLAKMCVKYKAILHTNVQARFANKGFPDVTIIKVGGDTAFVELKKEGATQKSLNPTQAVWRDKLLAQQANWFFFNQDSETTDQLTKWFEQ